MDNRAIPFRPKLEGLFRIRFYEKASEITKEKSDFAIEELIQQEILWSEDGIKTNIKQRRIYRAVWLFLNDLRHSNWKVEFLNGSLELRLPNLANDDMGRETIQEKKLFMRSWMEESKKDRLSIHSDFIWKMERESIGKKSVLELIGSGESLANKLSKVKSGDMNIENAIDPELILVREEEIDEITGHKLSDIWRYFRYTWSNPSESTPGRTMLYLIRDNANPNRPIMGLASLENSAVQITARDNFIGWTPLSFKEKLNKHDAGDARENFEELMRYLEHGISEISIDGLDVSTDNIENSTMEVIQKLKSISIEAGKIREEELREPVEKENKSELGRVSRGAVEALFVKKRSEKLSRLLQAKLHINKLLNSSDFEDKYILFAHSEEGTASIRTALVAQKELHVGSSIMELNVCGAIPPYNEILGGKLVALLATSPQVINDYKLKYSNHKSEIASRLKKEEVFKPSDLAFIGTTSLYHIGSSQYNRLKIPKNLFGSDFEVKWEKIGKTVGFGSMHISKATSSAFAEATDDVVGYSRINNVFGEGTSPKMRLLNMSVRELLEGNQEDSVDLSKHAMSRIVYGSFLAKNSQNYLLGRDEKLDYYFGERNSEEATQEIISFWRNRWVLSRINYTPIFERLRNFKTESIKVSSFLNESTNWKFKRLEEPGMIHTDEETDLFIQGLYRGKSAFADEFNVNELRQVHVETKLDQTIKSIILKGSDVVLTGNPGDGKTHIIRIIEDYLVGTDIICSIELDASTKTNEQVYLDWKQAKENGIPFVIAINAAVLFQLYNEYKDFEPIQSAGKQLINAINYNKNPQSDDKVRLFDLSKRNVLSEEIVIKAIEKITQTLDMEKLRLKGLEDVVANVKLINEPIFQERLMYIFKRVSFSGYHATLRELQAFISFVIFGDRKSKEIIRTSGSDQYKISNLIYEGGEGELFKQIRDAFDPSKVSHPVIDEKIVNGEINENTWPADFFPIIENIDPSNLKQYELKKRDFFFFNDSGDEIMDINNDDIDQFMTFLKQPERKQIKELIQKLNQFFGLGKERDSLKIWSSHRYGNGPKSILYSQTKMMSKEFAIGVPKLNFDMDEGLDYAQDFVRLENRSNKSIFLHVDFDIFKLLKEASNGVPVLYLDSDTVRKIWRFMDQLQINNINEDDEATVSIYDVHDKKEVEVTIDLIDYRFEEIIITRTEV